MQRAQLRLWPVFVDQRDRLFKGPGTPTVQSRVAQPPTKIELLRTGHSWVPAPGRVEPTESFGPAPAVHRIAGIRQSAGNHFLMKGMARRPRQAHVAEPSTGQEYARILAGWVEELGLDPADGTHSMRRTPGSSRSPLEVASAVVSRSTCLNLSPRSFKPRSMSLFSATWPQHFRWQR